jgi:viroplasmin and RNaseH domain-containing protein
MTHPLAIILKKRVNYIKKNRSPVIFSDDLKDCKSRLKEVIEICHAILN